VGNFFYPGASAPGKPNVASPLLLPVPASPPPYPGAATCSSLSRRRPFLSWRRPCSSLTHRHPFPIWHHPYSSQTRRGTEVWRPRQPTRLRRLCATRRSSDHAFPRRAEGRRPPPLSRDPGSPAAPRGGGLRRPPLPRRFRLSLVAGIHLRCRGGEGRGMDRASLVAARQASPRRRAGPARKNGHRAGLGPPVRHDARHGPARRTHRAA
jgi:hypothetical protein